ncbi:hypothetical protein EJ06DRAFT_413047 [Trichodelitschia bisporula]|uniref:Uncharacterized protein n=1 Tax=Trichodelitschia bisporula TaxID=703511 RepID=A0A6G1HYD4_9PEZI|nr:hypothetical protein EJ06DRAFT_413047 [Trichodelitschia bisporula]
MEKIVNARLCSCGCFVEWVVARVVVDVGDFFRAASEGLGSEWHNCSEWRGELWRGLGKARRGGAGGRSVPLSCGVESRAGSGGTLFPSRCQWDRAPLFLYPGRPGPLGRECHNRSLDPSSLLPSVNNVTLIVTLRTNCLFRLQPLNSLSRLLSTLLHSLRGLRASPSCLLIPIPALLLGRATSTRTRPYRTCVCNPSLNQPLHIIHQLYHDSTFHLSVSSASTASLAPASTILQIVATAETSRNDHILGLDQLHFSL